MHDTIFSGADLALDVYDGGHAISLVTFESRNQFLRPDGSNEFGPGFGRGRFAPLGMNEFLVRHNRNHWYQTPEMAQVAELIAERANGTRIVTYGSSMGAFAAVNFAHLLGAEQFIAVSPLFDVSPGNALDERRWAEDWVHTTFDYNHLGTGAGRASRGYVFFAANSPDRAHAELIAAHTEATLMPLEYGAHPVGFYLNRAYKMKRLVAEIAQGTFDEPSFWTGLAEGTLETHYPYEREASRLEKAGDVAGAIAQLDIAIEKSPDHHRLRLTRGNLLLGERDLDGAEADFRAAIALQPRGADAYVRLSYVHAARKDYDAAAAAMVEAIGLHPDRAEYHLRHGEWLAAARRLPEAAESMARATRLRPDFARAHERLAAVRARIERAETRVPPPKPRSFIERVRGRLARMFRRG